MSRKETDDVGLADRSKRNALYRDHHPVGGIHWRRDDGMGSHESWPEGWQAMTAICIGIALLAVIVGLGVAVYALGRDYIWRRWGE